MNKVILIGNLVRDPELRTTPSGKSVVSASIATNKSYVDQSGQKQQVVQFHNLVVWNKPAETFAKYLKKGGKVAIVGELQTRDYTDQQGVKRYVTDIIVSEFHFLTPAAPKPEPARPVEPEFPIEHDMEEDQEITVENIPF